jgi:Ala-tRNA(Pro) deacylase
MGHNIKLPTSSIQLLKQLEEWKIFYKHFTHEPLISVNESKLLQEKLFGNNKENGHIKNLYLRDKKKNNILFVAHQDAIIDLKLLAENINVGRLSFGSRERLMENLGVLPGAVSPFAMINGVKNNVSIYLDSKLKSYKNIFAHPLENNQTLEIKFDQLEKFFRKLSVEPKWINLDP